MTFHTGLFDWHEFPIRDYGIVKWLFLSILQQKLNASMFTNSKMQGNRLQTDMVSTLIEFGKSDIVKECILNHNSACQQIY